MNPVFEGEKIHICGKENVGTGNLWIRGSRDELAMKAEASW
jgi:hypothetical protein